MGRRSQVVKAAVCKTAIHRFESGRRLQIFSGSAIFYLAVEAFLYIFVLVYIFHIILTPFTLSYLV